MALLTKKKVEEILNNDGRYLKKAPKEKYATWMITHREQQFEPLYFSNLAQVKKYVEYQYITMYQ